ncbi:hypothetical protein JB92DRAFT_2807739 [Gautieria morchelliformis]|nr:hypothetical protein JB92DRAFT_2807739 [Gautieria morchelliformis]
MSLSLGTPLSLYSIPVIWATGFYPHNAKFRLINSTVGFNNLKPRSHTPEALEKKGVPQHLVDRIVRLGGAHENGTEIFPVWASAVLAANYAGIEQRTLNIVSGAFIGLRLLYNYIYINQASASASLLRTATWFTSIGIPMYLFIKAANKIRVGV